MSDALAQGLLGFAGGVAGTLSNEYENINKEKTLLRQEERDHQRTLAKEARDLQREKEAEKRAEDAKILAQLRQDAMDRAAQAEGRVHADKLGRAAHETDAKASQRVEWDQDLYTLDRLAEGTHPGVQEDEAKKRNTATIEAEQDAEYFRLYGVPRGGGTTALAPVAGATEAKEAIHTQVSALINDQILETDEYTLLVNTKKNPRARLTGVTDGKDVYKVFKDEENLPIIRAEIAGSMAPAINARVSKMVKNKTMTEEEMEATAIAIADSVDSVSAQWAKLGMNFDKKGNIPASVAARINQEIDRVVKSGGSREDAITALINNDLAAMREALGEYDNAYATLRKTMRPMLIQLYQWREPARASDYRAFGGQS